MYKYQKHWTLFIGGGGRDSLPGISVLVHTPPPTPACVYCPCGAGVLWAVREFVPCSGSLSFPAGVGVGYYKHLSAEMDGEGWDGRKCCLLSLTGDGRHLLG